MIKTTFLEPENIYHIYNRGNNKENLFLSSSDYNRFLLNWSRYIEPVAETYAYCLLPNHFHFLIKILPEQNIRYNFRHKELGDNQRLLYFISHQFSNTCNAYTRYFNLKHDRIGKLFTERFKRKEIMDDMYFTEMIRYIHHNPVKHGIAENYKDYPYSSYWSLVCDRPVMLKRDTVMEWFGTRHHFREVHDHPRGG
ncbi:MAG: hypothetical protein IPM95_10070 [Sphingobacteriales bacterium]|nr:hypothetical protein [Sphingobacteriales bacterium]